MTQATTKLVTDLRVLAADAEELVKLTASQTGEKFAAVRAKLQSRSSGRSISPNLRPALLNMRMNIQGECNSVR